MSQPVTEGRRWLVLASCCLSLLLVMMDVTIVNVVLPSIRQAFGASIASLQWIVDAYTLTVAALLMAAGSLADRFGRRRVFLSGITIFCVASAFCGLAATPAQMIAARILQGVGGAMLNPVALSIITNTFLEPAERAKAIGLWGMMSGVALALGPAIGGFIADSLSWRAVFWINLPIGLIAMLMTLRFVPESRSSVISRFDPAGQGLAALATLTLVGALIEGPDFGWDSPVIIGLLIMALVGIIVFVGVERRIASPMLNLGFLRSIPFSSATVLAILCFAIFSSLLFLSTIYLQQIRGFSPSAAGWKLMPFAAAVVIAAPLSGRLVASRGARVPLVLSGVGLAGGAWMLAQLTADSSALWLAAAYALVGGGFGLCNAPITNAAVSGMPRRQAGLAAAVASTSRQIGAALGVAVAGSVRGAGATVAGDERSFAPVFLGLSHTVCWIAVMLGCGVILVGLIATSASAQASARRVAESFS
ncbi:MFS transporter [Acetobacter conturbans]|uniref:DHA2 family efflux MFS transporter permease subunit n=1 Tax=Acetobacter conturbans TaxID=1737472 RepID=A0ABX0JVG4_9PROT|nr:MFS transporter [Acetobacter conturbans]NHN87377.1 DHA2 family efflux MFS transporter permease subunit [Acetobacter conturbans]